MSTVEATTPDGDGQLKSSTMMQHRGLGLGFDSNSATFFEFRKFEYLNYSNFELKSNFHVLHLRCVR